MTTRVTAELTNFADRSVNHLCPKQIGQITKLMRQVANIPHPEFTVNLYAWNNKYLLKFEHQWMEQTYKISEMDVTGDADVIAIVNDADFIAAVRDTFARMAQDFGQVCTKHL